MCSMISMEILKITKQSIKEAVRILREGGVVVYPTETAYAIGCDWASKPARARIFKIKKRPLEKDLPVICAHKAMAARFFKFNKLERKLAAEYWHGPLTMVLERKEASMGILSTFLTCGATQKSGQDAHGREVAVRVSSDEVARALSRGLGAPIISTSANISGKSNPYDVKTIIKSFSRSKFKPDLILDAGVLPLRKPSTIIRVEDGKVEVLREGEIEF